MSPARVVLCFLLGGAGDTTEVLLGLKKRGFGQGRVVGLGGHVEPGESVEEAAVREVAEESGARVDPASLRGAGSIRFRFPSRPSWDMDCALFLSDRWEGEPRETEEIRPSWHRLDSLPWERMWPDSGLWLPRVLAGRPGRFLVVLAADNTSVARFEAEDLPEA